VTCQELIEFLDDYVSGNLAEASRNAFDAHLKTCPNCVNYLVSYQRTIEMSQKAFDASEEPVPETVPEDLIKAIIEARRKNPDS
jgi:anti-sigma factor RsiW